MKKRILGLVLALCLIVGLLPMTAFAAAPASVYFRLNPGITKTITPADGTLYYTVTKSGDPAVDTFVQWTGATPPTDNDSYISVAYSAEDAKLSVTLNNITVSSDINGADNTNYLVNFQTEAAYAVEMTLKGTNKLTTNKSAAIASAAENGLTIKSVDGGKLIADSAQSIGNIYMLKGDLLIQDATLELSNRSVNFRNAITSCAPGNVTIQNSNITADVNVGAVVLFGLDKDGNQPWASTDTAASNRKLTITDSTITATKSTTTTSGSFLAIFHTANPADITNSTITCRTNIAGKVFRNTAGAPNLHGSYTAVASTNEDGTSSETFDPANVATYKYFHLEVHTHTGGTATCTEKAVCTECQQPYGDVNPTNHTPGTDDGDCATAVMCSACGAEAIPAVAAHVAAADDGDCTTATLCGNPGCTKEVAPAPATAHVAGTDDGDCTTGIKCTNTGCTKDAVAGKAAHTPKTDRTYACSEAHPCAECTKNYREAGVHTGGTATCQEKAKCESCQTPYGELAACKPDADDGDCTTAIKCSVCKKELTAAKEAHKYTDNADTTCDNEGCKNTRKVEPSGTGGNPQTADNTALVLVIALTLASAAAIAGVSVLNKRRYTA